MIIVNKTAEVIEISVTREGRQGEQGPAADLPTGLDEFTSITITAGDELELVKGGITYWTPLYRRA